MWLMCNWNKQGKIAAMFLSFKVGETLYMNLGFDYKVQKNAASQEIQEYENEIE